MSTEDDLRLRDDLRNVVSRLATTLGEAGYEDVEVTPERDGVTFYDKRSQHTIALYADFD